MSGPDHEHPVLDSDVMRRLQHELDNDPGIWQTFVRNYMRLLPGRIERLRRCLTSGDFDGAMDATLSLRTASEMIGADRLAALTRRLQQSLRDVAPHDTAEALPTIALGQLAEIKRCGTQTQNQLHHCLT